jgi:bifunctional oligoribonuclease and PAP phosphatase NrnA
MVAQLIEKIGGIGSITPDIATALLLGLYYDTECFRNGNTTPEAYEFSARMLRSGADHNLLIRSLYQSTDPRYIALYGEVLATLRPLSGGVGVFGLVTTDMLERYNIPLDSLGNELVNTYLRSVFAKYVILAKEDIIQGGYRMSFRSKDEKYNMRTLAGIFDGG